MIDIKLIRENLDFVKENIKKKFQDSKLPLVDEVYKLDQEYRKMSQKSDALRMERNTLSDQIGNLMKNKEIEKAEDIKLKVRDINEQLENDKSNLESLSNEIKNIMMKIPNIIDESVPIGKDDTQNVEVEKFGEAFVPDYEIPYHIDILENLSGIDLDSARRVSGNGFYYLTR